MSSSNIRFIALIACFTGGCYTTAPVHWSESHDRDVVQSRTVTPNGSRLDLQIRADNESFSVTSSEVPLCRTVETGYPVIKETGLREPHVWPATLFGLGMAGGGIALLADGLTKDSGSSSETKLFETLAGIGLTAAGAALVGKCTLSSGCDPDTDAEHKYKNGSGFRRWESAGRSDCSDKKPKSVGDITMLLSTTWTNTDRKITWRKQSTNGIGFASIPFVEIIRAVSAHCGVATTQFSIESLNTQSLEDTPGNPSQSRDDSDTFSIKTKAGPSMSPDLIRNETAKGIAWECAIATQKKCAGNRAASIETKCKTECNSRSGAGYCEEQKETELRLPDISDDERRQIDERYATCVSEHRVDASASGNCANNCTTKALSVICPNPWEAK